MVNGFCSGTVTFGGVLLGSFALLLCESAAVLMEGSHILVLWNLMHQLGREMKTFSSWSFHQLLLVSTTVSSMLSVQVVFKMCVSRVEPSFPLSQRREEIPGIVVKDFKWSVFRGRLFCCKAYSF